MDYGIIITAITAWKRLRIKASLQKTWFNRLRLNIAASVHLLYLSLGIKIGKNKDLSVASKSNSFHGTVVRLGFWVTVLK